MNIQQGELYWIHPGDPGGAYAGFRQPHVIIQNNVFNHSLLETVITCALSTNLKRADVPGPALEVGEGGLPHQSVVVVSQLVTYEKASLDSNRILSFRRPRAGPDGVRLAYPAASDNSNCNTNSPLTQAGRSVNFCSPFITRI